MFIKIDKKTHEETVISSEEMVDVLEQDVRADVVDEILTEIVLGTYEHSNRSATYKYRS